MLKGDVPQDWRRPLEVLQNIAEARVFGAFAWQHLTGLRYVHARSDVDLLWPIDTTAQPMPWLHGYRHGKPHDRRVDGELCLGGDAAVNWRSTPDAAARYWSSASMVPHWNYAMRCSPPPG